MDIYMFLKPANSYTENGIKKKSKMSPEINHVQWKLEKTPFEMHQNYTVKGHGYLT